MNIALSPLEVPEGDDGDQQMEGTHNVVRSIMVCCDYAGRHN